MRHSDRLVHIGHFLGISQANGVGPRSQARLPRLWLAIDQNEHGFGKARLDPLPMPIAQQWRGHRQPRVDRLQLGDPLQQIAVIGIPHRLTHHLPGQHLLAIVVGNVLVGLVEGKAEFACSIWPAKLLPAPGRPNRINSIGSIVAR